MPKVFISYSHDSDRHKQQVRELSKNLRSNGIDCTIDQYEPAPGEGWPQWMARHIRDSNYVILICTETYQRRVEGREADGKGGGVKWEAMHILNSIYRNECKNTKFIPITLRSEDRAFIPDAMFGFTQFDLSQESEYINLNKLLWDELAVDKPPLGRKRNFDNEQTNSLKPNQKHRLAEIAEKMSGKRIYDLHKQQVELLYAELDALEGTPHAGFANYLWVILYHEYCKRHMAPNSRESLSRKKTIQAMKHSPDENEKSLLNKMTLQTNIQEQLSLLSHSK